MINLRHYVSSSEDKKNDINTNILKKIFQLIEQTKKNSSNNNNYRLKAFQNAFKSLQNYNEIIKSGSEVKHLKGVGPGTVRRIDEIIKTGDLKELDKENTEKENLDPKLIALKELTTVTGIGPKKAEQFYSQGYKKVEDLIEAFNLDLLDVTHHISVGLKYYYDFLERISFSEIHRIENKLKELMLSLPQIKWQICGSYRRKKDTSGDIDILMTSLDKKVNLSTVIEHLHNNNFLVANLTSLGKSKYMGVCLTSDTKKSCRIDIRLVEENCYYPALLYFTGSKTCNKLMRQIAVEKNMLLNEYGLFNRDGEKIDVNSERDIFTALDILYLEPEERELGKL